MRVVGVFGVPGTGKSTLLRQIMLRIAGAPPYFCHTAGTASFHYFSAASTFVLGLYPQNEIYGGTDRLSMSCQQDVARVMRSWSRRTPNCNVIFEGDRLASRAFLADCRQQGYDLRPFYLQAPLELRLARFAERGSKQGEKFLAGRETKVRNLQRDFPGPVLNSITMSDVARNAEEVLAEGLGIKTHKGA